MGERSTPSGLRAVQFSPPYCKEAEGTDCASWDSSHDLSVIMPNGSRVRIGTFKHARWAEAVGKMIESHGLPGLSADDEREPES